MRRREFLGLAASVAAAGCADRPGGGADAEDSAEPAVGIEIGPIGVQPSILDGDSPFDVRGPSDGAFVRVPVRQRGSDGLPPTSVATSGQLLDDLAVELDGRTFGDATVDRVRGRWDRVLAVEVPSGEYDEGAVRLGAGASDPIRRPLPADVLAALADPPAFQVVDFVVSDPIELMFVVVTTTVENVGGADGRFLAGLGPTDGPSPVVVAFDVRAGERVTQTRNLTFHQPPGGPVTVRLDWGSGSAERRVVQPGT